MSREEKLCRRLCGYLGLTVKTTAGYIFIYPSGADFKTRAADELIYETFHDALFNEYPYMSLCNIYKCNIYKLKLYASLWDAVVRKAFPFSSLDELELQLSVRGF